MLRSPENLRRKPLPSTVSDAVSSDGSIRHSEQRFSQDQQDFLFRVLKVPGLHVALKRITQLPEIAQKPQEMGRILKKDVQLLSQVRQEVFRTRESLSKNDPLRTELDGVADALETICYTLYYVQRMALESSSHALAPQRLQEILDQDVIPLATNIRSKLSRLSVSRMPGYKRLIAGVSCFLATMFIPAMTHEEKGMAEPSLDDAESGEVEPDVLTTVSGAEQEEALAKMLSAMESRFGGSGTGATSHAVGDPLGFDDTIGDPDINEIQPNAENGEQNKTVIEIVEAHGLEKSAHRFWMTQIYGFRDHGKQRFTLNFSRSISPDGTPDRWLKVHVPKRTHDPNTLVILPIPLETPYGFSIDDDTIIVDPKQSVDFAIKRHSVTFASTAEIEYTTYQEEQHPFDINLPEGTTSDTKTLAGLSGPARAVIEDIQERPARALSLLKEYLRGSFTYVTSSQLDLLFSAMPVDFEQRVSHIPFGDCDVLADHAVYLAHLAGMRAGVAKGFMERDGKITTDAGHAQMILQQNGYTPYERLETTQHTKRSFKELRFAKEDFARLVSIVQKMHALRERQESPEEIQEVLTEFRDALDDILAQPKYEKFRSTGGVEGMGDSVVEGAIEKLQELLREPLEALGWEEFKRSFDEFFREESDSKGLMKIIVTEILLTLAAYAFFGLVIMPRYTKDERRRSGLKKFVDRDASGTHDDIFVESRSINARFEDFQHDLGLPESIGAQLTPEQKGMAVVMDTLRISTLRGLLFQTYPIGIKRKIEKFCKQNITEDDIRTGRLKEMLRELFQRPSVVRNERKYIRDDLEEIHRSQVEYLKELSIIAKSKQSPAHLVRALEVETVFPRSSSHPRHARRGVEREIEPSLRPYAEGDDTRLIDWHATARTGGDKVFVRETTPIVPKEKLHGIPHYVVIDLPSADNFQLARFAAMMQEGQRFGMHVTGIQVYAFGQLLREVTPQQLGVMQSQNKKQAHAHLQEFLRRCVRERAETSRFRKKRNAQWNYDDTIAEISGIFLTRQPIVRRLTARRVQGQRIMVFGNQGYLLTRCLSDGEKKKEPNKMKMSRDLAVGQALRDEDEPKVDQLVSDAIDAQDGEEN